MVDPSMPSCPQVIPRGVGDEGQEHRPPLCGHCGAAGCVHGPVNHSHLTPEENHYAFLNHTTETNKNQGSDEFSIKVEHIV